MRNMIHLAGSPAADSVALPGIERVWIVETEEKVLFRMLADPMEARSSAKATHPSPGAQKGKLN